MTIIDTTTNTLTEDKQKWIEELAAQIGAEVAAKVKAAEECEETPAIIDRHFLIRAISLAGKTIPHTNADREDVFVGDLRNQQKVETTAQLKKMCNEITHLQHTTEDEYTLSVVARIPSNYVGKVCEVRIMDFADEELGQIRFTRQGDLLYPTFRGDTLWTDRPWGNKSQKQMIEAYNYVSFKVDKSTEALVSWSVGPDVQATQVESLEHEFVHILS